jgi:type I site-specific restriction endonuclease
MKSLLSRLFAALGLVSARRFDTLSRHANSLKADSEAWKAKAGEATARVRSLEVEVRRQAQLVEKLNASVEKLQKRRDDVEKLRASLADAVRELIVAREHLMAIEVKLDILEGAANVLDLRTRTAAPRSRSGTGAPA